MHRIAAAIFRISVFGLLVLPSAMALGTADATHPSDGKRQLKSKVMPEYPDLAKEFSIKGAVRLELVVKPDGHVKQVNVLGGNPVLARAAIEAVRKWRYSPADTESKVVVKLDFDPSSKK
ncbi:MAG TPA: energy transducer TonB [Candidatus Angelobacter sp.]|nr:energy transducer TonB [Candidatus Angelobacter sp.]